MRWFNKANATGPLPGPASPFRAFLWFAMLGFLVMSFFGVQEIWHEYETRKWTQASCEILESKPVVEIRHGDERYVPDVRYRYEVNGHPRVGFRIGRQAEVTFSDYSSAAQRLAGYPVGLKTVCRVNPKDPNEAVLESRPNFVIFAVSPFLLLIWALYERVALMDWLAARRERRAPVRREPFTANRALR